MCGIQVYWWMTALARQTWKHILAIIKLKMFESDESKSDRFTVILQIFGVVLFSVFSVVNGFTEINKTPKMRKIHWVITTASTDTEN